MKPRFKTLFLQCLGCRRPIHNRNVKSNNLGFQSQYFDSGLRHENEATVARGLRGGSTTFPFVLALRNQPTDPFCAYILQTTIRDSFCHINFGMKGRKRGESLSEVRSALCEPRQSLLYKGSESGCGEAVNSRVPNIRKEEM